MSLTQRSNSQKTEHPESRGAAGGWDLKEGIVFGTLGMLGFSGTLVATRIAVSDFSPLAITSGRIVMAAALAVIVLLATGAMKLPPRRLLPNLVWMGIGLAVCYPLFLAFALEDVPAVHGAVVTGLAPAATAVIAVFRAGERMPLGFWVACAIGFLGVLYFALDAGGGHVSVADGWLFLAMVSLGVAYVEGGRASTELGGTVALCWAMLFLAPAALVVFAFSVQDIRITEVAVGSYLAFLYVGAVSMFLASVFWYRGLAAGGIARIGQINLLLPLIALVWPWLLLGETITPTAFGCAVVVFGAMVACLRSKASRASRA